MQTVLVTGGAGYIGSHTMVELLASGIDVICLDNFSNSSPEAVKRVEKIAGKRVTHGQGRCARSRGAGARVSSGRSTPSFTSPRSRQSANRSRKPVEYYDNNVGGTLALLEAMDRCDVGRFVFSSSATVYGVPDKLPIAEDRAGRPVNPYGHTKAMVEQMLRDWCRAGGARSRDLAALLQSDRRASERLIGEDPDDIPNNLFPFITQVAIGKRERLTVWGDDWPTVRRHRRTRLSPCD